MQCLDDKTLAMLAQPDSDSAESARLQEHLRSCKRCRRRALSFVEATFRREEPRAGAPRPRAEAPQPHGDAPERALGAQVGRYLLLSSLGEGGMGAVYVAYDPKLDRRVALKIVRPELQGSGEAEASLRQLLLREAQSLAQLSHPNVVTIYDVGSIGDELYIAMELVEGGTLRDWLEERPRSWLEVLRVFIEAGRGLSAAHAAGLVHRDFKPDNVLLGDDGRPRVGDFGLARRARDATDGASDDEGSIAGRLAGTPAYMAPEQREGRPADARSDQYSFCVSLYEALCGERPFRVAPTPDGLRVVESRLPDIEKDLRVPKRLVRALRRGLEARPDDRFPSMEALLDELSPLADRRRPHLLALGAALAAVAVAAGVAIYEARQPDPCGAADAALASAWNDAVRARARAAFEATKDPLALDAWTRAEAALGDYLEAWRAARNRTCRAVVDGEEQAAIGLYRLECLDRLRADAAALIDVLGQADATVVANAVQAVQSLRPLGVCANLRRVRQLVPPAEPQAQERVEQLRQQLGRARALYGTGNYEPAKALAQKVLDGAREAGYRPLEAEALLLAGQVGARTSKLDEAEKALQQAVFAAIAGQDDATATRAASWLVEVVGRWQMKSAEAQLWNAFARAALERLGGDEELEAGLLEKLGAALIDEGRFVEAETTLRRSLEIRQRLAPDGLQVAETLATLATALQQLGRYEEQLAFDRRVLEIRERLLGRLHPRTTMAENNVAVALVSVGEYEEAKVIFEQAIARLEKSLGPENLRVSMPLNNLAEMGRPEEALALLQRALAIREAALGAEHPKLGSALLNLGRVLTDLGRPRDGLAVLARHETIVTRSLGPDHPEHAQRLFTEGQALLALGERERGLRALQRAAELYEKSGQEPTELARVRFLIAQTLGAAGPDRARALALAEQALELFRASPPRFKADLERVQAWLAAAR